MALKKVKRERQYEEMTQQQLGNPDSSTMMAVDESHDPSSNPMSDVECTETPQKPEQNHYSSPNWGNIFPKIGVDVWSLVPNFVQVPNIPEGETTLTIIECHVIKESMGKHIGTKRATLRFRSEDGHTFTQTYPLDKSNPNFVKLIESILVDIPEGEILLDILKGRKVVACLYHNYTQNGKGYVNIAYCRPIAE